MILRLIILELCLGVVLGDATLDKIAEDFWEWRMQNNPEFASNVGDQRFTDQLEDYSLQAFEKRKDDMENYLQRLGDVNRNSLPSADRITYDVLLDTIQTWIDGYRWKNYGPMNPINLLEGIQTFYDSRVGQVKFENEGSFRKFAERISAYGDQIDQIMARLQVAITQRTTNNRESVVNVPASLDAIYTKYMNNVTAFPMYEPFKTTFEGIVSDENTKAEIRSLAQDNIAYLLGKINTLSQFMTNDYIPNARSSFGVGGLPNGAEYYKACLKWQLSIDITADEIHRLGIREVNRVHAELQKIVKRAKFNGTVQEYNEHLRNNASLFIDDPDVAIQRFQSLYDERIVPKLQEMFKDIPDVPLVIQKMPYNGPNGIYKNAAPDGSRPGVFYANVNEAVPTFDMAALMVHESDPGHHLQDAYALTSDSIPMFRRATDFSKYFAVPLHFPFYTAYSEGWGLYSEDLGEELGIYQTDLERFGKYGLEIFRAARLVVDTGIHAKGWSRDRSIEYMKTYTAYTQAFIEREIDRYATWPGQATSYMIGKLKIRELRDMAEGKLCSYFDIKEFHHIVVSNGAMPLSVLENLVMEWVDDVRMTHARDVDKACLNQVVEDFWEWRMKNNPEFASNVGDHRYTDMLEDYSLEAFESRKMYMDKLLVRLSYINSESLTFGDRVTFDVLKDTIQTWVDGYKWRYYAPMNPINRLEGIQTNYGSRAGQVSFTEEDDFRKFAKRILNYGVQIDQLIVRMNKAIEMGTTYHMKSIEPVPPQLDNIHAMYKDDVTAFPMYEPFKMKLDEIVTNEATKAIIRDIAQSNIQVLLAQMKKLANFLRNDYMPNTRSSFGVGGLPNGAEYYKACLKWQLSIDITAEEVHQQGLNEVNRVYQEIQKIMKKTNFKGTVKEYNDQLRSDDSLFITDGDVAIAKLKEMYATRIQPELHKMFEDIPTSMPLEIEKMTYDGPGGIYKNGAPDGSRPGVFYVNVFNKVSIYNMVALMLHEADPGHHMQDSYALTAEGIPLFRKVTDFSKYFAVPLHFPFYTAYSEGWGLYSEDLGEEGELDVYKTDSELFGKYGFEIFRAARLVVDTGIHAKNWSREHAIEYMVNYTSYSLEFISKEIDRYSTWPAQATSYMVGKLKIRDLRNVAENRLCNFKEDKLIKKFHSILLKNGAMPLSVMEDEVMEWVQDESLKNAKSGKCLVTEGVENLHSMPAVAILVFTFISVLCSSL